jgi:hypothetical protein
MAKSKSGGQAQKAKGANDDRPNGKANKKHPKIFDPIKRKLVNK